ncbi:MAG: acetyl-CoA decarbonylase/synthase complex subunit alpha/beta [Thermoanaerobacterales bacterium]|nr:acetyl-CoA decarbonylase/synthase complex subunit alpha/beta [Thermoanaerobacterales bacterium]
MSRNIATAAIRGAHSIVRRAEKRLQEALDTLGADHPVELPNTGYYLPVIYGITGRKVTRLADAEPVLALARELLPPLPARERWTPYLGPALDAGMATLFAEEIIEALRYVTGSSPGGIWLGAADDVILRERGIEFVDGRAPGFAAVVGAAPDTATAVKLAREMQQKNLYVFMAGRTDGASFAEQLAAADVQLGWPTRLVPFGEEVYAHIFSLGFATRVALSFGGVSPGDYHRVLMYNKDRVFAFVLALGPVTDEWYATAAGAINFGFPVIADTDIPQILPYGVCTYEHVVSGVPHDRIVARAVEVRGLKVAAAELEVPVAFGPAFEGEIIRRPDTFVEIGAGRAPAFEFLVTRPMSEVEDGRVQVVGPELDNLGEGGILPLGLVVEVAGRKMKEEFEPVLERRLHYFVNYLEGVVHIGQRDIVRIRISKKAFAAGLRLRHIGEAVANRVKAEFGSLVDKVQVTLYSMPDLVLTEQETARAQYRRRDERLGSLTDEAVDTFYTCSLCQSFAPAHICVVTPERLGLCGAVNWLDARASYELKQTGPNQPVAIGTCIDEVRGQFSGVNSAMERYTQGKITALNLYSMMENPMTSCGCFEAIAAVLPEANGIFIVNREYSGDTPIGMRFSTLAGMVGGGEQTPGFMGLARAYILSRRFIQADGGLPRVVWMPRQLKEYLRAGLLRRGAEIGIPDLYERVADETVGTSPDDIFPFLEAKQHPALSLAPIM